MKQMLNIFADQIPFLAYQQLPESAVHTGKHHDNENMIRKTSVPVM